MRLRVPLHCPFIALTPLLQPADRCPQPPLYTNRQTPRVFRAAPALLWLSTPLPPLVFLSPVDMTQRCCICYRCPPLFPQCAPPKTVDSIFLPDCASYHTPCLAMHAPIDATPPTIDRSLVPSQTPVNPTLCKNYTQDGMAGRAQLHETNMACCGRQLCS